MARDKAQIRLRLFDGARKIFTDRQKMTLRVHNGNSSEWFTRTLNTKSSGDGEITLNVDFFDNFADNYAVVVSADGYRDAGFYPVKVSPTSPQDLSLMLVPKKPSLAFDPWDILETKHPNIAQFLSLTSNGKSQKNYADNVEDHPKEMACLLNLATAMSQIFLANGTPLAYFRGIDWSTLATDRFFGYALPELVEEVRAAVPKKLFEPEIDPQFFHGGATASFKEIRLGEANVQLTFHEKNKKQIDSELCVKIEPDIDYYKDMGAHAILEVIANRLTNSLTDPVQVYVLRWVAGKQHGLPEFDPPYTLRD